MNNSNDDRQRDAGDGENASDRRRHLFIVFGVFLMMIAIVMYVLSLNEEIQPADESVEEVPAETAAD